MGFTISDTGGAADVFEIIDHGDGSATVFTKDPSQLDYESAKSYSIKVRVTDGGASQQLWDEADVAILITDVNDNAPLFPAATYSAQLSDSTKV